MIRNIRWLLLPLSFFALLFVVWPETWIPTAFAQRMRAQVYFTQAAIPRGLSERGLISFARGHTTRGLRETDETELTRRRWVSKMVVSFSSKLNDSEYHALFYEVNGRTKTYIDDMQIFLHNRDEKTFVQPMTLPRPKFKPNKKVEVVITVRRQEVGKTTIDLLGEEPRRSGRVDFSDEEARKRD